MSQTDVQEAQFWKNQVGFLQDALESVNENGLLKDDSAAYKKILDYIINALQDISANPPNIIKAREKISSAWYEFNQATNSASIWWRFKFVYGFPIVLYLLIFFVVWIYYSPNIIDANILFVPSWTFSWGLIGGILQGFWYLCENLWKRALKKSYYVWFFLTPLMGAILGTLAYLLFHTGFIAESGEVNPQSSLFPMLLSALAGFSSRQVIGALMKLVKKIFT